MKKILLLKFLFFFSYCSFGQTKYNTQYVANGGYPGGIRPASSTVSESVGWTTILGTTTGFTGNAWSAAQPIPFAFNYFGQPVTSFKASTNMLVTFDVSSTLLPNANTNLPTASLPPRTITGFWDEFTALAPTGANDKVMTRVFGAAPNQQLWIYWFSYEFGNPSIGFAYMATVLEQTTNKIYVVDLYNAGGPNTSSTVGVQFNSATAYQFGTNNISLDLTNTGASIAEVDYYEFAPDIIDLSATTLVSPTNVNSCNTTTQNVSIRIKNVGTVPVSFSNTNTATVTVNIVGVGTQNLSTTLTDNSLNGGVALAPNATLDVPVGTANLSGSGTYTFNSNVSIGGDNNAANNSMAPVTVTTGPLAAGTASALQSTYCLSGSPTLSLTGNSGDIQWQQAASASGPFTDISGATGTMYTVLSPITQTTYYRAKVSCSTNSVNSNVVTVTVNQPVILTSAGDTRCGAGAVTLTATPSPGATTNWYTSATGGFPVSTGNTYSPVISATTTYYAQATSGTCVSSRTPVVATVTSTPVRPTIITSGLTLTSSAASGNQWYVNGNLIPGAINQTYTVTSDGSYTVISTINGCASLASIPTVFTVDLSATTLVTPTNLNYCNTAAQNVVIRIRNAGNAPVNFSASNTATVTVNIVGVGTQNISTTLTNNNLNGGLALAPNATLDVPVGNANLSVTGTYTFNSNVSIGGDNNAANNSMSPVTVTVAPLNSGTASTTQNSFCQSGSPTLSLTGYSGDIQWQQAVSVGGPFSDISGATASTYTASMLVNQNTYYRAVVSCGTSSVNSNVVTISINHPSVLTTGGDSRCGTGSVTLTATPSAGATINWFNASTGGTLVATGNTYSPTVNATTTFYAQASIPNGGTETIGKLASDLAGKNGIATGLTFNATAPFTLQSVMVYTDNTAGGNLTVNLTNSAGIILQTAVVTLPPVSSITGVVVPLNFSVPAGTGMRLINASATILYRDLSGSPTTAFPYTSSNGTISITNASTTSLYYYFYQWVISSSCNSARTPVVATVNPTPARPTIFTSGLTLTSSASSGNQWYINGNPIPGATAQTYTVPSEGSYTVVSTINGCSSLASNPAVFTLDLSAVALVSPTNTNNCNSNNQNVVIRIRNAGNAPVTFSNTNTATITVNISGAGTQNLSTSISDNSLNGGLALAPNATLDVPVGTANMAATGTYNFNSNVSIGGDNNAVNNSMAPVAVTVSPLASGTASASQNSFCQSGTPTLSLAGYSGNVQWQQATSVSGPFTDIAGADDTPFTLAAPITQTTYFRAAVNCGTNTINSNIITVNVIEPAVLTANGDSRCGTGTVTLTATPSSGATINWYNAATGGTLLATGNTYSPNVSATTTYYAQATTTGGTETIGKLNGDFAGKNTGGALFFNATAPFTLQSVMVYTDLTTGGSVTINLVNSVGIILQTANVNLPPVSGITGVVVPLNFSVPVGTGLSLAHGGGVSLYRDLSGSATTFYPYTSSNGSVAITNGSASGFYYYFYRWVISSGCNSARMPVVATVNPFPLKPTISTSGLTLTSSATSGNQWYLSGNPISGATGQTYTVTSNGAYTVISTVNGCPSPVSNPATFILDLSATALVSPVSGTSCGPNQNVTVRIRNAGNAPINFSATNPATITVNISGAGTQNLNTTLTDNSLNGGAALAPNATLDVPVGVANLSAIGNYTFNSNASLAGDNNPANNSMTPVSVSISGPVAGTASAAQTNFCLSGTPTLNLSGYSGNVKWQEATSASGPFTDISGATGIPFTVASPVSQTTYYRAVVSCGTTSVNSNTVTITITQPTVAASSGGTRCGAGSVTLSATPSAGASISWYAAATGGIALANGNSYSPTVNATTTFYAQSTISGCSSNRTAVVATVTPIPAKPTISASGLTLTSSASTGNQWYLGGSPIPGATGQTYTVTVSGSYTVVATVNGCPSLPSDATNTVALDLGVSALINPSTTGCYTSGETVSVSIKNFGISAVNFTANPTTVTVNVTGSVTQTLTVLVNTGTLAAGASRNVTAGILNMSTNGSYIFNAATSVTGDGDATNNAMGQVTINVTPKPAPAITGLNAAYCKDASPVTLTSSLSGSTFTIDGVAATTFDPSVLVVGNHTVVVSNTNASGCTGTATQTVAINAVPAPAITNLNAAYCKNAPIVTLTSSLAGSTFTIDGVAATTLNPATLSVGTHTVAVSNTTSGCTGTASQTVTINAVPTADFGTLANAYCKDAAAVSLVIPGSTFTIDGVAASSFNPATLSVGNHTVVVTTTNASNCSVTATKTVAVNVLPAPSLAFLNAAYCKDAAAVTLNAAPAGFSNAYTIDGVAATSFNPATLSVGNHTVAVTQTNMATTCSGTATRIVTINAVPVPTITGLNAAYCKNDAAVTLTGSLAGSTFTIDGVAATTLNPAALTIGTHTVVVTNIASGCTGTASQTVTINALPTADFGTLANAYCKDAAAVSLAIPGSTFTIDGVAATTFNLATLSVGNHTVVVTTTNASNCSTTATKIVAVNAIPAPAITNLNAVYCKNDAAVTLTSSLVGSTFTVDGVAATIFDPAALSVGTHTVMVSNTASGCTGTSTQIVTINAVPTADFGTLANAYCKDAAAVSLAITGSTFTIDGVVATTFDPATLTIGNHTVVVTTTNASNCSTTATKTVTINTVPAPAITGLNAAYCKNAPAVTLTSSLAGSTFTIDGVAATIFDPAILAVGTHTVVVSNSASGCTGTASQTVTIDAIPVPVINGLNTAYCQNEPAVALTGAGNTYTIDGVAATSFDPAALTFGAHTVTVTTTNASGCTGTASLVVTINTLPTADFGTLGTVYCKNAAPISLVITGSTFTVDGVATTMFDPATLAIGAHTVVVTTTNAANCTVTATQTVTINAVPAPTIIGLNVTYCANESAVTLTSSLAGSTFTIDGIAATVFDPAALTVGAHTVVVSNSASGCTGTSTQTVTINSVPAVPVSILNSTYCQNAVFVTLPSGSDVYTIDGTTATIFDPLALSVGPHTVVITTTSGGCTATTNQTVTIQAVPVTPVISVSGFDLTSSAATGNQWYLDGTLIPGATGTTYTATANGTYTVITTANGCPSAASAGVILSSVGISKNMGGRNILVYPNPTSGTFSVKLTGFAKDASISLYSVTGGLIATETVKGNSGETVKEMNVEHLPTGVYMLKISSENAVKVTRLVVE